MNNKLCSHCHLPSNDAIKDGNLTFCCSGCQSVYHILQDNGLDSFYDKLGDKKLTAPKIELDDALKFDLPTFAQKYITILPNEHSELTVVISGIHCAACVWLNEKILTKADGIIEANINFTNHKARIVFDATKIKPSQIVQKIRSIGYDAKAYDSYAQEEGANKARKEFYYRTVVGVFASMNIMWIALALYLGYFGHIEQEHKNILHFAEWMLATLTLFYSGWPFFKGAYYGFKNGFVTMDTLVATGSTLAYTYSCYAAITEYGEAYFDSVTMIITFVLIGKFLEIMSKKKAVDTLDTISALAPISATVLRDGKEQNITLEEVVIGDTIVLKAGDAAPVDGVIIQGSGGFDESSLSGESVPVYKNIGAEIKSSAICMDATILYKATKTFANSYVSILSKLLEDALSKKPRIETLANQISRYFSLTILSIGLLTFCSWLAYGLKFEDALMIAISVIIIACPCALALATPIACVMGLSVGAKSGVIFKSSSALEALAKTTILFLDKTGTVTTGKLQVLNEQTFDGFNEKYVATLLNASKHPVAKSIKEYTKLLECVAPIQTQTISGKGLILKFENQDELIGGSYLLMQESGIKVQQPTYGLSSFYIALNGKLIAFYELKDTPRTEAKQAIDLIKALNIEPIMLTGDLKSVADEVAKSVGITNVNSELLPKDKLDFVQKAQDNGKTVAFLGDGVNDAPALALANASIAMPNSAEASSASADVIMLKDSLICAVDAFKIAKATEKTIKQNIAISIIYNAITIPLAACGFVIPLVAAASMSFSSLLVVGNSMRLRRLIKKETSGR